MGIQISPYLTFDGRCREAMTFYQTCFGGELFMQTVGESPMAERCPAGTQQQILHAMLSTPEGETLMGTDMVDSGGYRPGNDMCISVNFDDEDEINRCYTKLAEGGKTIEEMRPAPWNAVFIVLQDRFGKVWMLNHDLNKI